MFQGKEPQQAHSTAHSTGIQHGLIAQICSTDAHRATLVSPHLSPPLAKRCSPVGVFLQGR
eukprot:16438052-Heterocapsa_arctica.AAC.1